MPSRPSVADFERLPAAYAEGTSQKCALNAFYDDRDLARSLDTGAFIGRAKALFGEPDPGSDFVLRHRATGIVITIYSAGSGPAFGGGPVYLGALPNIGPELTHSTLDAIFHVPAPDPDPDETNAIKALLAKGRMHEVARRLCDRATPVGFAAVAGELESLMESVTPADWEGVEDSDDGPYRVGVRKGVSFAEKIE